MTGDDTSPFPLDGGRAGDGGGGRSVVTPRPRQAAGAVPRARRSRREQTVAEAMLWKALKAEDELPASGAPIGRFVVDFVHFASSLIVEVDGYFHEQPERRIRDLERTAWLQSQGFRVIRFPEKRVRDDLTTVVEQIVADTAPPPSPTLPPSRGKGAERYVVR